MDKTSVARKVALQLPNTSLWYVRISTDSVPAELLDDSRWSPDYRGVRGPAAAREMATASDGQIYMRQLQVNEQYGYALQVDNEIAP